MNDYRGELCDLELWNEKRATAAPLIDVPPPSALSSLREEQKDLALLLWIPDPWDDPAAPPMVQLGLDGVEAGIIQLSAAIPCAGAINGGGLDIANGVDQAVIPEKRRAWILSQLFKLLQQLVIELRTPEQIEPERLRSIQDYLAEVLGRLHRAVSSDHAELNQYERNLYDLLLPLPLIETDGGIRVSLRDLLSSDSMATSERLLSMNQGESKSSRATGDDLSSQTPEARLIEALLRELQWDENRKIKMVGNIGFHTFGFRDQNPSVIASVDEDRIWLHTRNDLVREILQMPKPDPVLTAIIASAVYSSLNRHFRDITSQDERKFVHELAKAVLANPSR
ncbi:MAG: hypothetical protein JRG94_21305 [Deltaproteobacteria bacterium]|nr:hypothetical protein [Deltaproteobacteria bacterium]